MSDKNILGTKIIIQIGVLVNDIEKTTEAWAEFLDIPTPDYFKTDPLDKANTIFRGEPTGGRCRQSFFECGQIKIELLEPDKHPSVWREALDKDGEGIHHIAFGVKDLKSKVKLLREKGFEEVQSGRWLKSETKNYEGLYSYLDSFDKLKMVVELLEYFKE